jgi:tRNA1Val (adenine37-N6)-methyltransferase
MACRRAENRTTISAMAATTRDAILGGKLHLVQPAPGTGYRMNQDAVLLADFAHEGRTAERALDLGAGVGAIGLMLLARKTARNVIFVEIDATLATLAQGNVAANQFGEQGRVAIGDVATFECSEVVDLVVCNPPFFPGKTGRISPREALNQARIGDVSAFIGCARRNVAPKGRVCFIYPVLYLETLVAGLCKAGLVPKRMRLVHPKRDANARVALVEAVVGKPNGLQIQAPWFDDGYVFKADE